ncbi:unnamed protein product [Miscanthus lutarioriparius]|uniref:Uncharacterized protein n=1 Tax=Miscanthus lutarioriparius TaxID=422564 RepID=A0A811RA84_9POAL|nr:unnamed protein product [Miscanthus lutarioriparius]
MPRPEFQASPDVLYNESEVPKYTTSSRINEIQDFREGAGAARSSQRWRPQAASRHRCCLAHVRVRVTACNVSGCNVIASPLCPYASSYAASTGQLLSGQSGVQLLSGQSGVHGRFPAAARGNSSKDCSDEIIIRMHG